MRIKCSYCEMYNEKLLKFLDENKVKYKIVGDGVLVGKLISFSVYSDAAICDALLRYIHTKPIVTNEFTHSELSSADYLTMVPIRNAVDIRNIDEAFQYKCKRKSIFGEERYGHKEQIGLLKIYRFNAKGATAFFSSSTGFSEIFVKEIFCEIAQEENITGIRFLPVFLDDKEPANKSGLYQISATDIIPLDRICIEDKKQLKKCRVCGKPKIICGPDFQLKLHYSKGEINSDFYMTDAVFGEGISYPLYLVSQRLYRLIVQVNMAKNIRFSPVIFE